MDRLTLEQAELVRIEAAKGISDEVLATQHGVSKRTIRDCRLGLRYKKADGPITKRTVRGVQLPDEKIRAMREEANGIPYKKLAEKYIVSVSYVSLIICGKRREDAGGPISGPRHKWFCGNSHI